MKTFDENEKWIEGYEGSYSVRSDGTIISYKYNKIRELKQSVSKGSNFRVCNLSKDKQSKLVYVHRIVAESFLPNPYHHTHVFHKDGDKGNNSVNNLEWRAV